MFAISKSIMEKIQALLSNCNPMPALQGQGAMIYSCSSCMGGCRGGCNGCDGCKGK